MDVLETSKTPRTKLGLLMGKLVARGLISLTDLCKALEETFSFAEDLIIDIPTLWNCLAEILGEFLRIFVLRD